MYLTSSKLSQIQKVMWKEDGFTRVAGVVVIMVYNAFNNPIQTAEAS